MKPNILYKYRPFNENTIKIFSDQKIWAPTLEKLNDPFDGNIIFDKNLTENEFASIIKKICQEMGYSKEKEFDLINAMIDENGRYRAGALDAIHRGFESTREAHEKFGIVCLSEHSDSILMWTHYCSEHKGVCIGFDVSEMHLQEPDACLKINYQDSYPNVTLADLYLGGASFSLKTIWTKAKAWAYEDEWRYVLKNGNQAADLPGPIREVIFGLNSNPEFEQKIRDATIGQNVVFKRVVLAKYSYKFLVQ